MAGGAKKGSKSGKGGRYAKSGKSSASSSHRSGGGGRPSSSAAGGSQMGYDSDNEVEGAGTEREWVPAAATRDAEKEDGDDGSQAPLDEFGAKDYRGQMPLRQAHARRPLWLAPNGDVFLETFSPVYRHAHDFLIAIAEPVCRPEFIHEYKLTSVSDTYFVNHVGAPFVGYFLFSVDDHRVSVF